MTLKELNKKCSCLASKFRDKCTGGQSTVHHGPLSENCQAGKIKICKVYGDRRLCSRMAALGVLPGKEAELIRPHCGSQCLLKIHGGTLTLDRKTSDNIIVQAV
jgi:Fe2+ transport system protein FeoA